MTQTISERMGYHQNTKDMPLNSRNQTLTGDTELDLQFLTFVEQYASSPIRSEILSFLGKHPERLITAQQMAQQIGRSRRIVHTELYELALGHIVEQVGKNAQQEYKLSNNRTIRHLAIRFASTLDA